MSEEPRVENIMKDVRQRVRQEAYEDLGDSSVHEDLQFVLDNSRLSHDRIITSHRRWIGGLMAWARRVLYGEIRRSVDPMFEKQTRWNRRLAMIDLEKREAQNHQRVMIAIQELLGFHRRRG